MATLESYECDTFTWAGKQRDVYRRGSGPAVLVIAEIPGITPKVLEFADRVVALGCTAVLPHLFGVPGASATPLNAVRAIAPACVSKEFSAWATGRTTPVVEWCKALARHEHERCGGPGVGVVGMCFTGNFALAMAPDPVVVAPVMSQPSLPFGVTKKAKRALYLSDEDLGKVQQRMAEEPDLCVLGLRFTKDAAVPPERFEHLREALGDRFVAVEIDSSKGNPWGHPRMAHSVLTEHLIDEPGQPTRDALEQVLDLFRTRLLSPA
ncbi:MAG TPA: dienelactone hydrolase family protein [Acidimicrobiales bacterium]|nr:dienelactone hydrolase family protein [Acidimicrobiales bacterium]